MIVTFQKTTMGQAKQRGTFEERKAIAKSKSKHIEHPLIKQNLKRHIKHNLSALIGLSTLGLFPNDKN
jgi:hypothetical protein